jgi:hypothetical protein
VKKETNVQNTSASNNFCLDFVGFWLAIKKCESENKRVFVAFRDFLETGKLRKSANCAGRQTVTRGTTKWKTKRKTTADATVKLTQQNWPRQKSLWPRAVDRTEFNCSFCRARRSAA